MGNKTGRKSWIRKIVIAAVVAELGYVIIFNLALQLPLTQSLINQIKPEKFNISWENAWTWYPFRFHIRNASGSGQSRSQQWEFETEAVSASIDVSPLLFKRVWISNVKVSNTRYYQRPRLKPDKDYTELVPFYPPIRGREVTDAVTTPKKKKKPWHVDIEGIGLDGQFYYWVHQFKGQARGTLKADLDVVSRGGLFSLSAPEIDLSLGQHRINGAEIFRHGELSGALVFEPFVPRQNRGINLLRYLLLDAEIGIQVNSLAFVNQFTRNFKEMSLGGTGQVEGRLHLERGRVLEGTGLSVVTDDLKLEFMSHMISGDGAVQIDVDSTVRNQFHMDVRFNNLVMHQGGGAQLFTGLGLRLTYKSAGDLFRVGRGSDTTENLAVPTPKREYELGLQIPTARVDDMSAFNYYLPEGSPFKFSKGTADLKADVQFEPRDAGGFLRLKADGMQAQIDEQTIRTNFSADISLVGGVPENRLFDISGTELRLDDVEVKGENDSFDQKNWATVIDFTQAELVFVKPLSLKTRAKLHMTDSRPIVAMLGNKKDQPGWVKKMLTIDDVKGVINLDMADDRVLIPDAFIDSEKIDVGAKGIIKEGLNDGVIYARYKKLDFVVKYTDGKRNIDLIRARGKFDEYKLPDINE